MTRAIIKICRQCHGPERRSICRAGERHRQGRCGLPCGLCNTQLAQVHGEALDPDVQSPLKRGNVCTGGKGRLQVGQGKEGVRGEGKKKVQSLENSGYSQCSGADLPLRERGGGSQKGG